MKLTQIDIIQYKSIKQPVSIFLNDGRVVALIGKNGSGKTNILEAMRMALTNDRHSVGSKNKCRVRYHFDLTDKEAEQYFACVQEEHKSKHIAVDFDSMDFKKRHIDLSSESVDVADYRQRLKAALDGFKKAAEAYIAAMQKIETDDGLFDAEVDIRLEVTEGTEGFFSNRVKSRIESCQAVMEDNIERMSRYIDGLFDGDRITLERYESVYTGDCSVTRPQLYKISACDWIRIGPAAARLLKIDESAVAQANADLNKKLKKIDRMLSAEYKKMQACLDEYDKVQQEVCKIFGQKIDRVYEHNDSVDEQFKTFIQKLREGVFFNCYYLDNEKSLLFYDRAARGLDFRRDSIAQYLNSYNPILEAFDAFLHDSGTMPEGASLAHYNGLYDINIPQYVKVLNEDFLPGIVAEFDSDEVAGFEVQFNDNKFDLFVREKSGDVVPFDSTSLGRRWYLTYRFIKALLKPGDVLFIDEPAAFLHQQAKTEVKRELSRLGQSGVYVFYSTHSAYLIPDDWEEVYNVTMTDNGTAAQNFSSGDELGEVIRNDLGATRTADILFNLSKTMILVEGIADEACIEKFAELLGYDLSNYHIHVCDGEAILHVAYVCLQLKAKVKVVLDNDNKYKGDEYAKIHPKYRECIKEIDNSDDCVFVGDEKDGCIENLFAEQSPTNLLHKVKKKFKVNIPAVRKLQSVKDVSEQTRKNFDRLLTRIGIPKRRKRG